MDDGPACEMLVIPGGTPINFPAGYGVRTCHEVFVAAFDGFTKYVRDRYRHRVAAYFVQHGAVDNDLPSSRPRRHLADLIWFARQAGEQPRVASRGR